MSLSVPRHRSPRRPLSMMSAVRVPRSRVRGSAFKRTGSTALVCVLAFAGVAATAAPAHAGYYTPSGYVWDVGLTASVTENLLAAGSLPSSTVFSYGDVPTDANGSSIPLVARGTLYGPTAKDGDLTTATVVDVVTVNIAENEGDGAPFTIVTSTVPVTEPGYYTWKFTAVFADQTSEAQAQLPEGWSSDDVDDSGWAWMDTGHGDADADFFVAPNYSASAPAVVTSGDDAIFTTEVKGILGVPSWSEGYQLYQAAYLQKSDASGNLVGDADCSAVPDQQSPFPDIRSESITGSTEPDSSYTQTLAADHELERGLYQYTYTMYERVQTSDGVTTSTKLVPVSGDGGDAGASDSGVCGISTSRTFVDSAVPNYELSEADLAAGIADGQLSLSDFVDYNEPSLAAYMAAGDIATPNAAGLPAGLSIVDGAIIFDGTGYEPHAAMGTITSESGLVLATYSWTVAPVKVEAESTMVEGARFSQRLNSRLATPFPEGSVYRMTSGEVPDGLELAEDGTLAGIAPTVGVYRLAGDVTSTQGNRIGAFDWALDVTPAPAVVVEDEPVEEPVVDQPAAEATKPPAAVITDSGAGGGGGAQASATKTLASTGANTAPGLWLSLLLGVGGLLTLIGARIRRARS